MKHAQKNELSDSYLTGLSSVKSILRDKYVTIAENGKVIFFVIDEFNKVQYASDYVNEILNYTPEQIIGKDVTSLIEPASIPTFNYVMHQLRENLAEPVTFKDLGVYCTHCTKHFFDGLITFSDVMPNDHYVMYLHDVTDRKRNEESLMQINLELDSFIYKASHDLRAPLASLAGLINLTERSLQGQNTEYVELMKRSINRLDEYINKLAHYTRNSNLAVENVKVNFQSLLNDSIETYKFLPGTERIDFQIKLYQRQQVCSDEFRLQLIMNNLISNAIKYQNPHEQNPYIEITIVSTSKSFRIRVRDNGIGISEEYREKIFDMFQRATTQAQGSGIGLYIVKKALLKLKGKVEVSSKYGLGTQFKIRIPNYIESCVSTKKSATA